MTYIIEKTRLEGAFVVSPKVFFDNRGYFFESFSKRDLIDIFPNEFVQDNQSLSLSKGILRGLHCQTGAHAQSKLIRVITGEVIDVIVDVRKESPTFLMWERISLSGKNHKMLFVPKGFLHGFVTLTNNVIFCYKVDEYYDKSSEKGVIYNDPLFSIDWGVDKPILSEKDKNNPPFNLSEISFG
jgi:dTDP-4-dehydrorhamnose 3,5-epimerase